MTRFVVLVLMILGLSAPLRAATEASGTIDTGLVLGSPKWQALLPDGYEASGEDYPIIFFLHGGGGGETTWAPLTEVVKAAWANGSLPPSIVVMVDAQRSLYMDYKDGSEKWESFYLTEFVPFIQRRFRVSDDRDDIAIMGISMGGLGSLRMAFKRPDLFGTVAAMEPGIESRVEWDDLTGRDTHYRKDVYPVVFGDPVDKDYWQQNHPTFIAARDAEKLRDSGLNIYLEVGDEDMVYLHYGTEVLHRTLWDNQVKHEYRLVRGADHVGGSMGMRIMDALGFIGRSFDPPNWSDAGQMAAKAIFMVQRLRDGRVSYGHDD